jgi:hypothetical protein
MTDDFLPYQIRHQVNEYTGKSRWVVAGPHWEYPNLDKRLVVRSDRKAKRVARQWLHRWNAAQGWATKHEMGAPSDH